MSRFKSKAARSIYAYECVISTVIFLIAVTAYSQTNSFQRSPHCGTQTPPTPVRAQMRVALSRFRESNLRALETAASTVTTISIHFHIIQDDDGSGSISDATVDAQVEELNAAYAAWGYKFRRERIDRTTNGSWYHMAPNSKAEKDAKSALGMDQQSHLNFYTAAIGNGLLGWATFPIFLADNPTNDGVVILNSSLPGGTAAPYNLGKTAVHEVGHWLGLYHTFEGGCVPPGDEVDDTPPESSPAFGKCSDPGNQNRHSCPGNGPNDDISNYMDYVDDACMNHFTPGQGKRMQQQVGLYRSSLLSSQIRSMLK